MGWNSSAVRLGLMARDSSSSSGSGSQKAWDNAYLQDDFVRTATPERLPDPDTEETIDPGARHPFQPCIVDFSFPRIRAGHLPVVERPTMDELLYTHGPARLMRERHDSTNPSLRWVHLPCNSMQYAEALMERVCAELGMNSFVARGVIMSDERWGSRLHRKTEGTSDGYHATFMQTTCSEIAIDDEFLEDVGDELERAKYRHAGANIALFMPFLHWGTEAELDWRDGKIEEIERLRKQSRNGRFRYPFDQGASELSRFYTRLMTDQLFGDRPLHLRRTLDQFYYFSASNTAARDRDQVVSKFGPERANVGSRPLLMVDQLWLWVLGGSTLITCFDRSLEDNDDVHFNLLDHVLWKLSTQARRIQSAYELAHLVIYEASGFIFKYSYSIPRARRFHEIFRSAIATVSNAQTDIFAQLERLCHDGPTMELSRKDQNELFDIGKELSQVKEVRDIIDELVIIAQVYEQQLSIMPALFDMQYSDALFWAGKDDLDGKHLPRDLRRMVFESDSSGSGSGSGGDTAAEGASAENSDQRNERKERKEQKAEKKERMPSRKWDERGWFNRTRQYTEKHRDAVLDMINETERVYNALRDTIDLKQNNASIYEAHSSRKETEAIMVFTLVSSFILPMSFFTSVFGMNVSEFDDGSQVKLGVAMAYAIPLSLLLILVFVTIAFRRDVRDWTLEALNPNKKLVKNPLRGRKSRLPGSRLPNHPHHHAKADEKATSGSGSSQSTGNSTAGLLGRLRGRGGLLKKRNAKEMV